MRIYTTIAMVVVLATASMSALPPSRDLTPQKEPPVKVTRMPIGPDGTMHHKRATTMRTMPFTLRTVPQWHTTPGSMALARRVAATGVKLRGALIDNSQWWTSEAPLYGIYEFSTGDATYHSVKLDPHFYVMDAIYTGDVLWTSYAIEDPSTFQVTDMTYYTYDPQSWQVLNEQVGDRTLSFVTSAWSPTDEMAYCTYGNSATSFGCFDIENGQLIGLGSTTKRLTAMAEHADGTLYGVDADGTLVTINKMTGKNTAIIGNTGQKSYWRTSAAIDSDHNIMYYMNVGSTASSLWAIDLETAEAVKLYDFTNSEQILGLYVVADDTPATVPAAPSALSINFPGGSLTGTVSFDAPATFYDGTPGSGSLTYSITVDDAGPVTGSCSWGTRCTAPLTVDCAGQHTISVALANSSGTGPAASINAWIGTDVPAAVTGASASWADGIFTVKWTAPSTGVNGGWIDTDALRYRIVRMPDDITVAQAFDGTTFSDPVEEPQGSIKGYQYVITPIIDGVEGESVTTSKKSIGYLLPPFVNGLEDSSKTAGFTVVDSNNDGKKWAYNSASKALRCIYNSSMAMDDWVFSPAIQLEGGKTYTFSFSVRAHNATNVERVEAGISSAATVASVQTMIVGPTDVQGTEWRTLSGNFTPQSDGRFRLAIHGISPKDQYYLYATNIAVSSGAATAAPAPVQGLTVTPGANGALTADIAFTAPTIDGDGNSLSSLTRIDITRGDVVIKSFENSTPGATLTYTDTDAPARHVTYTVTPYNASGAGASTSCSTYIGYAAPMAPTALQTSIGSHTGEAVLSWNAPEADINGQTLSQQSLTYNVVRIIGDETETVATALTACTYSDSAVAAEADQCFATYTVVAVTTGGESQGVTSDLIPLGRPHEVPFAESFANGRITYEWGLDSSNPAAGWLLGQDASIDDINSEDGDNGLAIMQGMTRDSWASLISGSIAIPADGNPTLSFSYFNYDCTNRLQVYAAEAGSNLLTEVALVTMSGTGPEQWTPVTVDLSAYRGHNIQLYFKATIVSANVVVIDNIRISDPETHDLAVRALSLPARIYPSQSYEVSASVENRGLATATDYTVTLMLDGDDVATLQGQSLAPAGSAIYTFTRTTPPTARETLDYAVRIDYASDMNTTDNLSATYTTRLMVPQHPAPTALTATADGHIVNITWQEPDLSVTPMTAVTDGAEDYTPYSTGLAGSEVYDDYVGDWTMVDRDGVTPFDISSGGVMMNYPNAHRPIGFMVLDTEIFGASGWETHSGARMFVSLASAYTANDDWMISPRLDGSAQTVSFWARSLTTLYGNESMQVYTSQSDTAITSFSRVLSVDEVPDEWTLYTIEVPTGTRHFAIRCTSAQTFALLVDDITFTPAHPAEGLVLTGYNIYRDGVLLNDAPLSDTTYADDTTIGIHTYHVTAIYDRGESPLSAPATAEVSGVNAPQTGIMVSSGHGGIVVAGAATLPLRCADTAGRIHFETTHATDPLSISLAPGVYMLRVGNMNYKVLVK